MVALLFILVSPEPKLLGQGEGIFAEGEDGISAVSDSPTGQSISKIGDVDGGHCLTVALDANGSIPSWG